MVDADMARRVLSEASALSRGRISPGWDVADDRRLRGEYLLTCLDWARVDRSSLGLTRAQEAALPQPGSPWMVSVGRCDADWGHDVAVPDPARPGELYGLDSVEVDPEGHIVSVTLARERTRMDAAEIVEAFALGEETDPFLEALLERVEGADGFGLDRGDREVSFA